MIDINRVRSFFLGDYDRKTIASSSGAFLVSVVFAFYNGYLGIYHKSLWYGSICIYYCLLSILRVCLILSDFRLSKAEKNVSKEKQKVVFILTHIILLVLNISLIVPISLMVRMLKPVKMTLIPAIAMAAYTTYKMTIASINMIKKKRTENLLIKELRTIDFIDALLSIAVLQNTLIIVNNSGGNSKMLTISAVTSAGILILMVTVSVLGFVKGLKQSSQN